MPTITIIPVFVIKDNKGYISNVSLEEQSDIRPYEKSVRFNLDVTKLKQQWLKEAKEEPNESN